MKIISIQNIYSNISPKHYFIYIIMKKNWMHPIIANACFLYKN